MNALKQRMRGEAGESFVESLASLLIASLAIMMLAGAIVTAGRLNARADETTTLAAQLPDSYTPESSQVTFTYNGGAGGGDAAPGGSDRAGAKIGTIDVELYDAGGLYYYEPKSEGAGA